MERKYFLFDAKSEPVGRLATKIARILSGKNKVDFAPYIDGGDFVVLINSDGGYVTGNKGKLKLYHRFSGYPGGITTVAFEDQMKKDSREVFYSAVHGMLPKNKLRKEMLKRLLIYKDEKHEIKNVVTV
jgi:large subunit ribosomal protein L13